MRWALFGLVLPLVAALQVRHASDGVLGLEATVEDNGRDGGYSISFKLTNQGSAKTDMAVLESPDLHLWNLSADTSLNCPQIGPSSLNIRCEAHDVDPGTLQARWRVSVKPVDPWATNLELPVNLTTFAKDPATGQLEQTGQRSQTIKWTTLRYRQADASTFPQPRTITVSALPDSEDERARLRQVFQWADFVSTGFYLNPKMPLTVTVAGLSDEATNPEILVGTPGLMDPRDPNKEMAAYLVASWSLYNGQNTVSNLDGGILYIRYTYLAGQAQDHPPVNVTLEGDAAQKFPLFRQGATTDAEWLAMLAATTVPFAEVEGARVIITGFAEDAWAAARGHQKNQQGLLDTYKDIIAAMDAISGLDANAPDARDRPSPLRPIVVWAKREGGSIADAWDNRVAIRAPPAGIMWDQSLLSTSSVMWHEFGHQRQHTATWSWESLNQVTVGIYALAARRLFPDFPYVDGIIEPQVADNKGTVQNWDKAKASLTRGIQNFDESEEITQLIMFEQLRVVFGDGFYHELHRRSRRDPGQSGDAAKKHYFMTRAAEIAQTDLGAYFTKWGLHPEQRTMDDMAKRPKTTEDYTTRPVFGGT
ncbi:hypothetical protein OCS_06668 [Ophiocordyceps sinensis CO18]|uniref:Peptidase M60 domain-containing protein n=1 Tax=Ophiocordyceps sinensis (strain Co18 / CGMCC 3.14243) TaxID=911162 RepID=T4ZWY4_OPHSC|nr:hypothetical protein OCS_06668 [Ophiocordyceps sinensis CO18]